MNEENLNKKQGLPVWAAICISVLAVAVVVLGTLWAVEHFEKNETEEPTTPTQAPTVPIESKDYTGTADTLVANRDQVVATVGDRELTNAKLQVYYWMGIYDFISENSYYLPYIGLDQGSFHAGKLFRRQNVLAGVFPEKCPGYVAVVRSYEYCGRERRV